MFYNCESLISLPDISKWNTNNVTDMSNMFSNCESLIFLPTLIKKKFDENLYFGRFKKIEMPPEVDEFNNI